MDEGPDARDVQVRGAPVALVLRALGLGDLLVAVPALAALRRGLPSHRIVLAAPAWLADAVALLPVDAHLPVAGLADPVPLPPGAVDVAVNLHGDGRESAALLRPLAARRTVAFASPGRPGLARRAAVPERARWLGLLEAHGFGPGDPDDLALPRPGTASPAPGAVVLHVGAAYGSRRWPADRFAEVARGLAAAGERVVLSGSAAERPDALAVARDAGLPDGAVLAGSMPLSAFMSLVAGARLLVSGDTGAAHLATAFGTPSAVLFGPAPAALWGPPPGGPHVVLTDAPARVGDVFGDAPDPALLAVTPADVLAAARALLAR